MVFKNSMDDLLCNRLRKGDKKALDEIYCKYHAKIFGFAVSYLKTEDDALDIVQETFVKLWESRATLKNNGQLKPLLFTVTKNAILSLFRKRATENKYLEYLGNCVITNTSGTTEQTDFDFLQSQYEQLIPELPPKRREIFLLSRKEGLSNKEIAKAKGISEKTVENQITKALAFFKENMDDLGALSILFFYLFVA